MKRNILFPFVLLFVLFVFDVVAADAQPRGPSRRGVGWKFSEMVHRAEIGGYLGHAWTSSYGVYIGPDTGEVDVEGDLNWGVELDVNVRPGVQLALLYNRMDSRATFEQTGFVQGPKRTLGDLAVEHWHIGVLSGASRGDIFAFAGMTVGGTRFDGSNVDRWKLSLMPQLGVKIYPNDKVALRLQARLPMILIDSGFALGFGTGGSYAAIDGAGLAQVDLSGGIMILLGN